MMALSVINTSVQGLTTKKIFLPSFCFCPLSPFPCPGMKQEGKLKMRVEPGLFEWTKWVSGNSLPTWISPVGLAAANLSVDTTYKYRQII